jgi:eukaryotic-like serine/threonine-protein kinase
MVYTTGFIVSTSAVFYNVNAIFGSDDHHVYALDALTGELRWSFMMGTCVSQSSSALHDGVIFIGGRDQTLYAIYATDGSLKWTFTDHTASMEQSTPIVQRPTILNSKNTCQKTIQK